MAIIAGKTAGADYSTRVGQQPPEKYINANRRLLFLMFVYQILHYVHVLTLYTERSHV